MKSGSTNILETNRFLTLVKEHQELWTPLSQITRAEEILRIVRPFLPKYTEEQLLADLSEIQDYAMENGELDLEDLEKITGGLPGLGTIGGKIIAGVFTSLVMVMGAAHFTANADVVIRTYNPYSGLHHYTSNVSEVKHLANLGWITEQTAFETLDGGVPVYRVYNPIDGHHLLTMDANEVQYLVGLGWQNEGVAFYALPADDPDGVPVYRAYNPGNGEHFYTMNLHEVENAVAHGWNAEGVAFRVGGEKSAFPAAPAPVPTPPPAPASPRAAKLS